MDEMLKKTFVYFGRILKVNTSITLPCAEIIYFPGYCLFLFEFQLLYSAGPSAIEFIFGSIKGISNIFS